MFSIFAILFVATAIGVSLAVFMTRNPPPGSPHVIPEAEYNQDDPAKNISITDLQTLVRALFSEHELTLKETVTESPTEEYWIAESNSPLFSGTYVFGLKEVTEEEPFISLQALLQFKDFIKGIEKNKGFFLTNGFFVREVHQPLEGVPVTLYNKLRVLDELDKRSNPTGSEKGSPSN
jgi:hypothetical protein